MRLRITAVTLAVLLTAAQAGNSLAADMASHQVTGEILAIRGLQLTLQTRTGDSVLVDASAAVASERATLLRPGALVTAQGDAATAAGLLANIITRAKPDPGAWPPDR